MISNYAPIKYDNDQLILLDQRKLPNEEIFVHYDNLEGGFQGIKQMVVRGAPCIGFTAIYSIGLWLKNNKKFEEQDLKNACDYLKQARPTAVNLSYEIDRTYTVAVEARKNGNDPYQEVIRFADEQIQLSEQRNRSMAKFAVAELQKKIGNKKLNILTHCNTGFLACGSIGTALGVVQELYDSDLIENVWVDETRPYLQGSRLTAYELSKLGVPHKVVVEGAASYLFSSGKVDAVFVGADRIVANGDTANKIGTSNLAILAKHFNIPFYVVAPISSFDLETSSGDGIKIELRDESEILNFKEYRIAPKESKALNPSFDVTKSEVITGIVCEEGVILPDFNKNIKETVCNGK